MYYSYNQHKYGNSDWSEVRSFTTKEPFVEISEPNGGEVWSKDSKRHIIRWNSNISGAVKIELFKNNLIEAVVSDSIVSYTGASAWKIPAGVEPDSTYKMRISLLSNSEISSTSNGFFAIKGEPNSVDDSFADDSKLFVINYPNPYSKNTTFEFYTDSDNFVQINLYDIKGNLVANIVNEFASAGNHVVNWTNTELESGTYLYEVRAGSNFRSGKLIITK